MTSLIYGTVVDKVIFVNTSGRKNRTGDAIAFSTLLQKYFRTLA